jgi:glutamine amidotransferase
MKIAIIDYGAGNLRSVERGLAFVGAPGTITGDPAAIDAADAIVLPGVGAFEAGMRQLAPLQRLIKERIDDGAPFLGICLGMQMLYELSDEGGQVPGLGVVPGRVTRFQGVPKVPHMGWNSLAIKREHPFLKGIPDGAYVYFVHSYRAGVNQGTIAASDYGGEFTAIASSGAGNAVGTQFHPEKSGALGLRMLKNFVDMI